MLYFIPPKTNVWNLDVYFCKCRVIFWRIPSMFILSIYFGTVMKTFCDIHLLAEVTSVTWPLEQISQFSFRMDRQVSRFFFFSHARFSSPSFDHLTMFQHTIGTQPLVTTAMTTLSSKIINVHKRKMAQIAVDAVMAVANLERNDVNFDMIKVRLCVLLSSRLVVFFGEAFFFFLLLFKWRGGRIGVES